MLKKIVNLTSGIVAGVVVVSTNTVHAVQSVASDGQVLAAETSTETVRLSETGSGTLASLLVAAAIITVVLLISLQRSSKKKDKAL